MVNTDKPITLKLLFNRLNSLYPLSGNLKEYLNDVVDIKVIKKGVYLLKPGQIPNCIYFIESGMIRCYLQIDQKEVSMAFRKEEDIVPSMNTFRSQGRSNEYIHTIEDCLVYTLSYEQYKKTCEQFPDFNIHILLLMERNYILTEECLNVIKNLRAHARYAWLTKRFPDFPQRVTAKHLASYIGITEGMLSVIKCRK
jgi:CRP-like cAMP-binding protein